MFGADRVSPNGDANIGIWFFQNTVKLNPDGSFSGLHKNGDIFVISAFTGGSTSNIQILQWNTSCKSAVNKPNPGDCADTNLKLLAVQASTVACTNSPYCATTNALTTNSLCKDPSALPSSSRAASIFLMPSTDPTAAPFPASAASWKRLAPHNPPQPSLRTFSSAGSRSAPLPSPSNAIRRTLRCSSITAPRFSTPGKASSTTQVLER